MGKEIRTVMNLIIEYVEKINSLSWKEANKIMGEDEEPKTLNFDPDNMATLKSVKTFL